MRCVHRSTRGRGALLLFAMALAGSGPVAAQGTAAFGTPGGARFGGSAGAAVGLGGTTAPGAPLPGRGSLIGDGMGGFTIYQGRSHSRYLGPAQGPGTVHHPGGGISTVIGDGNGGATVSGPAGTYRNWRPPARD